MKKGILRHFMVFLYISFFPTAGWMRHTGGDSLAKSLSRKSGSTNKQKFQALVQAPESMLK